MIALGSLLFRIVPFSLCVGDSPCSLHVNYLPLNFYQVDVIVT